MEGKKKALPSSLDISFFTGPTVEKTFASRFCRQRAHRRIFMRREESLSYLLPREVPMGPFEVNTDFPLTSNGVEDKPMSVRQIEAQHLSVISCVKVWLATGTVAEM